MAFKAYICIPRVGTSGYKMLLCLGDRILYTQREGNMIENRFK